MEESSSNDSPQDCTDAETARNSSTQRGPPDAGRPMFSEEENEDEVMDDQNAENVPFEEIAHNSEEEGEYMSASVSDENDSGSDWEDENRPDLGKHLYREQESSESDDE